MRKIKVKPYGFDKLYLENDLIGNKLCQMIGQLNERKITPKVFYSIIPNKIHPFYDENEKTSKVLFANGAEIMKLIDEAESIKIAESQESKRNRKTNNKKLVFILLNAESMPATRILK